MGVPEQLQVPGVGSSSSQAVPLEISGNGLSGCSLAAGLLAAAAMREPGERYALGLVLWGARLPAGATPKVPRHAACDKCKPRRCQGYVGSLALMGSPVRDAERAKRCARSAILPDRELDLRRARREHCGLRRNSILSGATHLSTNWRRAPV